ncbi:hypothetical protein Godav_024396 [Gossypium davidsonii]|nr:hypothetical protein [Gossypium davidsonii]
MMKELHIQGTKIEDIVAVLKRTPIHARIIQAIKSAHALGCDLKIVSDANVFFIDTILKHHGLKECFSEINMNPSFVDEEGRLRSSLTMISLNIPMDILILALQTCARVL